MQVPAQQHSLHRPWKWYCNIKRFSSSGDWKNEMHTLTPTPMDTVETFWGVFDKLRPVDELSVGSDYLFFRSDISPMWEDPANEGGGRWSFCVNRSTRDMSCEKAWTELLLMHVGNTFEMEEDLCGVVIGKKKIYDRLSIWVRQSSKDNIMNIGNRIRSFIGLSKGIPLNFQYHSDVIKGELKPVYTL